MATIMRNQERKHACSLSNTDKPDHIWPSRPPRVGAASWDPRPSTFSSPGNGTEFDASFHTAVTGKIISRFHSFNY